MNASKTSTLAAICMQFVSGCATLTLVVPPAAIPRESVPAPVHAVQPLPQPPPPPAGIQPLPERRVAPLVQEESGTSQDMGVLVEFVEGGPSKLDVCTFEMNEDDVLSGKCISYENLQAEMKKRNLERSDL